jgi:hypothetical protein
MSTGRPAANRVAIGSWHLNPGDYATNSRYQLTVRTAWSEVFAFSRRRPARSVRLAGRIGPATARRSAMMSAVAP